MSAAVFKKVSGVSSARIMICLEVRDEAGRGGNVRNTLRKYFEGNGRSD